MADKPPVNLDRAWLERFLDDVRDFQEEIRKITADGPNAPALYNLLPEGEHGEGVLPGAVLPLTIGGMAGDGITNGKHLSGSVVELIKAVNVVLENQKVLFDSIEEGLETTLDELFKAQGDNLEKIDGEMFLDVFSDVDEVLSGGRGEDD